MFVRGDKISGKKVVAPERTISLVIDLDEREYSKSAQSAPYPGTFINQIVLIHWLTLRDIQDELKDGD
jgi:hypothetical protein